MIIAIDIGTTSAKAALFSREGACVQVARVELSVIAGMNPVEQEVAPEVWLSAVRSLLSTLSGGARGTLERVECLVVSGHGPTLVPVGADGEILHNAITWMDRRSVRESAHAEAVLGHALDPAYNLPKVLWIREHLPGVYEKTKWFSSCPEFVCAHLCGRWVSFLPAEGYQEIIWDDSSLDLLGLDKEKFPPFIRLGEVVGGITQEISRGTGLRAGTPVVAGGPDFIVSLIGTATTSPRRACDRSGTSEGINLCWGELPSRDSRLLYMPHVIHPYWNVSGVISTTGRALTWFMEAVGGGAMNHEDFFRLASAARPGADSLLFLPYLTGERAPLWDPDARGVFMGLSLRHGKGELARAVAESAGFAMRDVIEVMRSTGAVVDELRVTGQPAGNPVWNQMKADISGIPIVVPSFREAELLGDFCLAKVALGDYRGIAESAEATVRMGRIYEPDREHRERYDALFSVYRQTYAALKPLFGTLSSLGS